jgi:hypothetical protein
VHRDDNSTGTAASHRDGAAPSKGDSSSSEASPDQLRKGAGGNRHQQHGALAFWHKPRLMKKATCQVRITGYNNQI